MAHSSRRDEHRLQARHDLHRRMRLALAGDDRPDYEQRFTSGEPELWARRRRARLHLVPGGGDPRD